MGTTNGLTNNITNNLTNNLTEEELVELRDAVSLTLTTLKRSVVKKKLKIFGKSLLSVMIVVSGVAVAIVFPSPITFAVLGGAAALIGGNNGVMGDIKNARKDSARARGGKKELKALNSETASRKITREVLDAVSKHSQLPSAPPLYPSLQQ